MASTFRSLVGRSAISAFLAVDSMRRRPQRYILLLAHMRSGSSLLLHILASNTDIAGCGELNSAYANEKSLARLALRARLENRLLGRAPKYVVDQLNHAHLITSEELLSRPEVWCIYLLREPAGAISSMTDVLRRFHGMQLSDACTYYRERLSCLARYAEISDCKERAFVLNYDELTSNPRITLDELGRFLDLDTPLAEDYRIFPFTGKRGDPSQRISIGRIVTNERPIDPEIPLPALAELNRHYDDVLQKLRARCQYVESEKLCETRRQ